MMNLHKTASELRAFGTRAIEAANALDGKRKPPHATTGRVLSKEARQRIADAQRKRWKLVRSQKKAA